jgi:anti-sigma factor RsiW
MLNWFDWPMRLPSQATKQAGLELVGSRPCLYGQGKVAHIMYRHNGQPVSLFMLPKTERAAQLVQALGHQAAIWCEKDRTFVLIARERKEDVQRIASLVQASLR